MSINIIALCQTRPSSENVNIFIEFIKNLKILDIQQVNNSSPVILRGGERRRRKRGKARK